VNPESIISSAAQEIALQPFNFSIPMGVAKIAAGVLKFLGKRTYSEKCPFAASLTNKFALPNATKNFWMSG
jgi:hypothetical protein